MAGKLGLFRGVTLILVLLAALPLAFMAQRAEAFGPETRLSDLWFRTRRQAPRADMVIVARDDKTLQEIGQPGHAQYGRLIRTLKDAGARLIVLDLDLDDRQGKAPDRELWTAIEASRSTLVMIRYQQDRALVPDKDELRGLRALEKSIHWQEMTLAAGTPEWGWLNFAPTTSDFIHSARGAGVAVTEQSLDPDHVLRRSRAAYFTKVLYPADTKQGQLTNFYAVVPNLAVITAVTDMGGDQTALDYRFGNRLAFGGMAPQPLDPKGYVPVNYAGPAGTYPRVSMADVLRDRAQAEWFKDKIVFIGSTADGDPLTEARLTPFGSRMPRVEVTANMVQSLLDSRALAQPHVAGLFGILTLGLMLGVLVPVFRTGLSILGGLLALGLYLGAGWFLFTTRSVMLPLLPALVLTALALVIAALLALAIRPWSIAEEVEVRDTGMAINPGEALPGTPRRRWGLPGRRPVS